uniref:RNA helicase n=1 Tax=Bursaphelenchus xylophilus TaxID=6326 RepID=A0A1I7S0Q9_BURXY
MNNEKDNVYIFWACLFEDEICQTLMTFTEEWKYLAPLFPEGQIENYWARLSEIGDIGEDDDPKWVQLKDLIREIWSNMINTANDNNFYNSLMEYLNNSNPQVRDLIDMTPSDQSDMETDQSEKPSVLRWIKVLNVIKAFEDDIDVRTSLNYMMAYSESVKRTLYPILSQLEDGTIDELTAKRKFLRSSVLFGPNSELHLLRTVWERGEGYHGKVRKFMPQFEKIYEIAVFSESRPDTPARQALNEVFDKPERHDPLVSVKIPDLQTRSIVVDIAKERPINLRNYQAELTEGAVDGENTLICAPTNSGKTLTAVYICRKRWYEALKNRRKFKAVLFVPTRVLVEQQYKYFQMYMQQLKITSICGDDSTSQPHRAKIQNSDVIVMTPMTLLNILNCPSETASDHITLDMFTLLIFDECHHTNEKYPFNEIMNFYHDLVQTGSASSLPQIVGLTASIGAKEAKDAGQARDYCAKICANLDVRRINRVRRHTEELLDFSPVVVDEIFLEPNPMDGCFQILTEEAETVIADLLEHLKDVIEDNEVRGLKGEIRRMNIHAQICSLETQLSLKVMEDSKRQKATDMITWIKMVNQATCMARLTDKYTMLEELKKENAHMEFKTGYSKKRFQATISRLEAHPDFKSTPFEKLLSIIREEFAKNSDTRVLAFVETRVLCLLLAERLQHYTGIETKHLTGSASAENAGLNKAKQNEAVRRFRNGEVKILCCTSVADEGLDIPECNVVVKYNDTTNEVAHVQRKGRGRAQGARSILIAENEWIQKMEETNQERVRLMRAALDLIDNNLVDFQDKVKAQISANKNERDMRRIEAEEAKEAFSRRKHDYVVACRGCNGFLVHSTKIFKNASHFTAADSRIWMRVETTEYLKADRIDSTEPTVGKINSGNSSKIFNQFEIRCQNLTDHGKCGQILGSVVICRLNGKVFLPILKCSQLVFVEVPLNYDQPVTPLVGKRVVKKQWKQMEEFFRPRPMTSYEWADMARVKPTISLSPGLQRAMQNWSEGESIDSPDLSQDSGVAE